MIPVKLPKEVLSLFPMWEYRCPCCSTYVESNKSFCPNCKTPFDEKRWRVPPRFLKSHDAMSEYAHKVLAPKLTPKQRELLFQYFTELFSDGFESGDFSAWTSTSAESPSTIEVQSTIKYSGTYACKIYAAAGWHPASAKITFTEQATVYFRDYLQFDHLPDSNTNWCELLYITCLFVQKVRLYNDAGTVKWQIVCKDDVAEISNALSSSSPVVDTWYCVEIKGYKGTGADGELRLYVDGVDVCSLTGLNIDNTGFTDARIYGTVYAGGSTNVYHDCVVVADAYIGPEAEGETYTKTWTTDALFKKLGIPKTLGVDATFQKQNIQETFGIDAEFLKRHIIKSFTVDARFGALMTQTISKQIDVLLKKLDLTKNFGLDVYFGSVEAETYSKTFGVSVILAYKVRLPELWLDENGKIVLNISKPYIWVGT